jgi:hypothetical protein
MRSESLSLSTFTSRLRWCNAEVPAEPLLDFAKVQDVDALGNFANGNVDDGLDGGSVNDCD